LPSNVGYVKPWSELLYFNFTVTFCTLMPSGILSVIVYLVAFLSIVTITIHVSVPSYPESVVFTYVSAVLLFPSLLTIDDLISFVVLKESFALTFQKFTLFLNSSSPPAE